MIHAESNFQQSIVKKLRYAGFLVFSVPNGQRLSLRRAALAKAEGLLAGVSDLIVVLPNKVYFCEVKTPLGNGHQSHAQREFEEQVRAYGHEYLLWDMWPKVDYFIEEHKDEVGNYLAVGGTK